MKTSIVIAVLLGVSILSVTQLPASLALSAVVVMLGTLLVGLGVLASSRRGTRDIAYDHGQTQPLPRLELEASWFD